jgi:hypothetical protein
MINIGGEWWRVLLVSPHHPLLKMGNGKYAVGVCDDPLKTIAVSDALDCYQLRNVLCHELTHAAMYSYNIELGYEQEEVIANLFAAHGQEIIDTANLFFKTKNGELIC